MLVEPLDLVGNIALEERIHEIEGEAPAQRAARPVRQREMHHGQDGHFAGPLGGALRFDVEPAQRFDRVAEQLDAHRVCRVRRKDVQDAAAKGELACLADEIGADESILHEPLQQRVRLDLISLGQHYDALGEGIAGRQAGEKRPGRNNHDVDRAGSDHAQRADLFAHHAERRRELLIR